MSISQAILVITTYTVVGSAYKNITALIIEWHSLFSLSKQLAKKRNIWIAIDCSQLLFKSWTDKSYQIISFLSSVGNTVLSLDKCILIDKMENIYFFFRPYV